MNTIHTKEGIAEVKARIESLKPDSMQLWGKMNVAQMLAHVRMPLEVPLGRHTLPKSWIMKLLGSVIKKQLIGEGPVKKNSPTAKSLIVANQRNFQQEKTALLSTIDDYYAAATNGTLPTAHPYWGTMTVSDWDKMQSKHLDHHLGQFGA